MTSYLGSDFSIKLPKEAIDATLHTFVFPQDRPITPTLVVRVERHWTPTSLEDYVDGQLKLLQAGTEKLDIQNRRAGIWHDRQAVDLLVEWGPPDERFRQRLVYLDGGGEPQRIFALTATDTADSFESNAAMFSEAIMSFAVRESNR